MYFPNMATNSNTFVAMILFVYVTVLSVLFAENCTSVKRAGWPPMTVTFLPD